jgi:5-methylcytosine-specific restriction endonuclease McrA
MSQGGAMNRVSPEVRDRVLNREKRRCARCLQYFGDHRVMYVVPKDISKPISDENNLIAVCSSCEQKVH